MKLLMIDNYDSFVYNLVQYLGESGMKIFVRRNDRITIVEIERLNPAGIVISPGPGIPEDAGICCDLVEYFAGRIPILGICLGHQVIARTFGAGIVRAEKIVHGKVSKVFHNGGVLFQGIENPFSAGRYHSLIVEKKGLPECLRITAWTEDGTIMGVAHKRYVIEGLQFHPESILTASGKQILNNFIKRSML